MTHFHTFRLSSQSVPSHINSVPSSLSSDSLPLNPVFSFLYLPAPLSFVYVLGKGRNKPGNKRKNKHMGVHKTVDIQTDRVRETSKCILGTELSNFYELLHIVLTTTFRDTTIITIYICKIWSFGWLNNLFQDYTSKKQKLSNLLRLDYYSACLSKIHIVFVDHDVSDPHYVFGFE